MNEQDYLQHWGIAKGGQKKNHRYYKRIDSGNPKHPYIYFYSAEEYAAYLKKGNKKSGSISNAASNTVRKLRNLLSRSINSFQRTTNTATEQATKVVNDAVKKVEQKRIDSQSKKDREKRLKHMQEIAEKYEMNGHKRDDDSAHSQQSRDRASEAGHKSEPKNHKYIAKLFINGRYRYFYTQAELNAFYNNNPDYKDPLSEKFDLIKTPETEYESQSKINPNYKKDVTDGFDREPGWSNNCYDCTLAYEARRRGLDVEAIYDPNGGSDQEIASMYEGVDTAFDYKSKRVHTDYGDFTEQVPVPKKNSGWDTVAGDDMDGKTRVNKLADQLSKKYPDGARGNLLVGWNGGGGHSMAWEKQDGQIFIHDAQNNTVVPMKQWEYADYVTRDPGGCYALRTDDKTFSQNAARYLQPADDVDEVKNTKYRFDDKYMQTLLAVKANKSITKKDYDEAVATEKRINNLDLDTTLKDIYGVGEEDRNAG